MLDGQRSQVSIGGQIGARSQGSQQLTEHAEMAWGFLHDGCGGLRRHWSTTSKAPPTVSGAAKTAVLVLSRMNPSRNVPGQSHGLWANQDLGKPLVGLRIPRRLLVE